MAFTAYQNEAGRRDYTASLVLMLLFALGPSRVNAAGLKEMNPPAPPPSQVIALVGGRLIDGKGGPPLADSLIVIRDNRIVYAGVRAKTKIPQGAESIDCRGMSVLPGLIDSHFHSRNNLRTPVDYELKNGITTFRDPGHPLRFYDNVLQSDRTLPRIFLCGAHLDAHPPVWADQAVVVKDADHARRTVNRHIDRGATAIKVYFRLPLPHITAVCEAANKRGAPVIAHLELVDADDAINAGVRGIEHVTSFGTTLAVEEEAARFKSAIFDDSGARRKLRHRLWANIDLDSPRVRPLLDLIVKKEVFVSPTLAIFERRAGQRNATDAEVRGFANMLQFVGLCHRAGAKVVVGSHTSAPFAKKGRAYQRELELLVEAGLTPLAAITAATSHNAAYFGVEERLGVVEAGKLVDLLLVAGDPSNDIAAAGDVKAVMLNGVWTTPLSD